MENKTTYSAHVVALRQLLKGDVADDKASRWLFSTDASAYQELPAAVVWPRDERDVELLVGYAARHQLSLIPRGAGTSLAGQVVGNGIVVDVSKYLNAVLDFNADEQWVEVQPGVVLDELNLFLKPKGLFFGPETSTSSRCTIGGMVGNNSCGSRSLVYGSTRDHLLEVQGFLSNGDKVRFGNLDIDAFHDKTKQASLEGHIYNELLGLLGNAETRGRISREFPHPDIKRRNTGYAVDLLMDAAPFAENAPAFNMCKIIAGSEGTLMFVTRIRLGLLPLPPNHYGLLCAHFHSLDQAIRANQVVLGHGPCAVELMDKTVLDLTKDNIVQKRNRFFVQGDPQALLQVEINAASAHAVHAASQAMVAELTALGLGYAFPLLEGADIGKVWALRKAGLGVLSNMAGDDLPVPVIEDTAVAVDDLQGYLTDIAAMLERHGKSCVFYGHIGTGELHLRPVLDMKKADDRRLFRTLAEETAAIVKKYRGSLSGEHGDGRLRGEFIPFMVGDDNYRLLKRVKQIFDQNGIFNPGKIIDTPPMDTQLRYTDARMSVWRSVFRWDKTGGMLQGAEKCTGSADCRKNPVMGGTMCPTFMVARHESQSTRARANMMRLLLSGSIDKADLSYADVMSVLDMCLMCKACKAECPSNVDVAKLKMEFLAMYRQREGASVRDMLFVHHHALLKAAAFLPNLYNGLVGSKWFGSLMGRLLKMDVGGGMPLLSPISVRHFFAQQKREVRGGASVWLFVDEFTDLTASEVGIAAIRLLERLGYQVRLAPCANSGRALMSKGFLAKAAVLANKNVTALGSSVTPSAPLVGIEPSAVLSFRDEYPDLVDESLKVQAGQIAKNTFTIEEFLWREMEAGRISSSQFTDAPREVLFHTHCYQKALSEPGITKKVLEFPVNYRATEIKSGCCGMAGAFGYEREHADMARKVGELSLFPAVRECPSSVLLAASGTSCRSHISRHTNRQAVHPVCVLFDALAY